MRPGGAENEPTGRLFRTEQKDKSTMNNTPEEKRLATINPSQLMQISSDVAAVCSEIVKKTAIQIKGRRYIRVEGWQALATAHGCVAGCRDVERVSGGFSAIGELRRISDGGLLAVAEGFVGEDEIVWFGGQDRSGKTWPARPIYAVRAMAQTRAISRVCRSAFAHVVVLIDENLSTTPAEEADQLNEAAETETSARKKHDDLDLINAELMAAAAQQRRTQKTPGGG